jgi:hypothetical protein
LVAGALTLGSVAMACTYTVGTTEVVSNHPPQDSVDETVDTTSFRAYGQIGPSAEQPYFDSQADSQDWEPQDYNEAVEQDYYMYTFFGEFDADFNKFPCLGKAQSDTEETHKDDVQAINAADQAKVVTATERIDPDRVENDAGLVMVCFASTDKDAPPEYQPEDGPTQPKFSTYWAPFRVF